MAGGVIALPPPDVGSWAIMGEVSDSRLSDRRYRRRILGWGAAALVVTFVAGSAVTLARVEDDLEVRTAAALAEAGVDGATATFSGQDATVDCAVPLDEPQAVVDLVEAQGGVRDADLGAGCTGDSDRPVVVTTTVAEVTTLATTTTTSTTTTTLPDPATLVEIIVDDPQFSVLENAAESIGLGDLLAAEQPVTVFAPTDDAFAALGPNFTASLASDPEALTEVLLHHVTAGAVAADDLVDGPLPMLDGTSVEVDTSVGIQLTSRERTATVLDADLDAVDGVVHVVDEVLLPAGLDPGPVAEAFTVVARYEDGRMVLSGEVTSAEQGDALVAAANGQLAPENVDDRLVVDPEAPVVDDDVVALATLVGTLPVNLVVGEVVLADDGLFLSGVHVDDAARDALESAAAEVGAVTGLTERPSATAAGAVELEARLNAIVLAEPIRFEPAAADLTPGAAGVLDRVAAAAKSLGGVVVVVEGHTDSDGSIADNLELSQERAVAVVAALVARGVPAVDLEAVGRGSSEPVVVDGVEDKVASRRVEFVVVRE